MCEGESCERVRCVRMCEGVRCVRKIHAPVYMYTRTHIIYCIRGEALLPPPTLTLTPYPNHSAILSMHTYISILPTVTSKHSHQPDSLIVGATKKLATVS